MIIVFLVLWATVSVGWSATTSTPTCASLPLQKLKFKRLVLQSPFRVVYSPGDSSFLCASILYTMPTPGSSGYNLGSTYINKTSVMGNYQLTINGNKTSDTAQYCTSGSSSPHLFLEMSIKQKMGFCIFSCSPNGSAIMDLKCVSRGGGFNATVLQQVLKKISGIPGAPTSTTLADCTKPPFCDYFD